MIYVDPADFFKCVRQDAGWSKDIGWLTKKFAYVPVFIYGTHQKNYSDAELLENYPPRGYGTTARPIFTMYKTGDGEPVVFKEEGCTDTARIAGEIYQLPPPVVFRLDREMCNGLHFHREIVHIRWWDVEHKNTSYDRRQDYLSDAFMYVADKAELQKLAGFKSYRQLPRHNVSPYNGYVYRYHPLENVQHRKRKNAALRGAAGMDIHTHDV